MKAVFVEKDHSYWLGDKRLISVTQLLAKHRLSRDYSGVDENVLRAKAERGAYIHAELEAYIKHGKLGFSQELCEFIKYSNSHKLSDMRAEIILNNDIVAGRCDLMAVDNEFSQNVLYDYKTGATLNKEDYAWQLSIYEYLSGRHFDRLVVLYFPDGKLKEVELTRIDKTEIEKLLECERKGELYTKKGLALPSDEVKKIAEIQSEIANMEKIKKRLESELNIFKDKLIMAMADNNVKSVENDYFKATYIEPSERISLDIGAIKEYCPDIYEKFKRVSKVKPSVRLTLRG